MVRLALSLLLAPLLVFAQSEDAGASSAVPQPSDAAQPSGAATDASTQTTSSGAPASTFSTSNIQITQPSSSFWWVTNTNNTLSWTGTSPDAFSIYISHPDDSVMAEDELMKGFIRANVQTMELWGTRAPPGPGYVIKFTNNNDPSIVYATSEAFEMRPWGSPTASAEAPTGSPSTTGDAAASGTDATAGASGTDGGNSTDASATPSATPGSGAGSLGVSVGALVGAAALALVL